MPNTRIVLRYAGFRELLNSSEVLAELNASADRIAAAAGPGFAVDRAKAGRKRARATVYADTVHAKHAEASRGALTKAIDAGR